MPTRSSSRTDASFLASVIPKTRSTSVAAKMRLTVSRTAASLGMTSQGEANFRVAAILVEEHADVANEESGVWFSDADLRPVPGIEQRRGVHLAEERSGLLV